MAAKAILREGIGQPQVAAAEEMKALHFSVNNTR